jgi:regulator of nonsense transcripts 2
MSSAISAPNRASLTAMASEQREKEDTARIARQRPVLRVCSELALVGVIQDNPTRSGGDWIMKALKELVNHRSWQHIIADFTSGSCRTTHPYHHCPSSQLSSSHIPVRILELRPQFPPSRLRRIWIH